MSRKIKYVDNKIYSLKFGLSVLITHAVCVTQQKSHVRINKRVERKKKQTVRPS